MLLFLSLKNDVARPEQENSSVLCCSQTDGKGNSFLKKKKKTFELTKVAHTSRTANTVNVFLNVTGQVKVDDMFHVAYIQTSSSHLQKKEKNKHLVT